MCSPRMTTDRWQNFLILLESITVTCALQGRTPHRPAAPPQWASVWVHVAECEYAEGGEYTCHGMPKVVGMHYVTILLNVCALPPNSRPPCVLPCCLCLARGGQCCDSSERLLHAIVLGLHTIVRRVNGRCGGVSAAVGGPAAA